MRKQDLNGVRTAEDVERRHNLGAIPQLEEDVSKFSVDSALSSSSTHAVQNNVITNALNSLNTIKVDKVAGKVLSDNNFTDSDKESIHTHNNKDLLDTIITDNVHLHYNKDLLDTIITDNVHLHYNKDLLDLITSDKLYELDKVYPIGSVYISINNTNPSTDLGGTWVYVDILTIGSVTAYAYKRTS